MSAPRACNSKQSIELPHMAPRSRLLRVGAAILCATPGIDLAKSFALHVPVFTAKSSLSNWSRVSCRPFTSATSAVDCRCSARGETTQDHALDERSRARQGGAEQGTLPSSSTSSFVSAGAAQNGARSNTDGELMLPRTRRDAVGSPAESSAVRTADPQGGPLRS